MSIIGGSDGPTAVFIAGKLGMDWLKRKGYLIDVLDKYTGKLHPETTESGTYCE